jgi:hypothetical protein
MPESVNLLMHQFLAWIAARPWTYAEAMDAWRSSCPRLTVWEDALIDGLIQLEGTRRQSEVTLTPRGKSILDGSPSS